MRDSQLQEDSNLKVIKISASKQYLKFVIAKAPKARVNSAAGSSFRSQNPLLTLNINGLITPSPRLIKKGIKILFLVPFTFLRQ